jgi:hypothetical protein
VPVAKNRLIPWGGGGSMKFRMPVLIPDIRVEQLVIGDTNWGLDDAKLLSN